MSSSDKREYILWYGYANKGMCISYQKLKIYLYLLIRLFNWMKYLNVLWSKYLWLGFLLTMTKMTSLAYLKDKKHRNLYLHQTYNIEICLFNKYKTVWKRVFKWYFLSLLYFRIFIEAFYLEYNHLLAKTNIAVLLQLHLKI